MRQPQGESGFVGFLVQQRARRGLHEVPPSAVWVNARDVLTTSIYPKLGDTSARCGPEIFESEASLVV